MITQELEVKANHIDLANKVYDEEYTMKVFFFGFRVFKKKYKRVETVPNFKEAIGFKK